MSSARLAIDLVLFDIGGVLGSNGWDREQRTAAVAQAGVLPARSATRRDAPVPDVPFWGARVLRDIALWDVYGHIDRNSLFKMSWQFRGVRDPEQWEQLLATELEPRLQRSMEEAERDGWLELQAVYGYWPALAEGDSVVVYDPGDIDRELGRFAFARQAAQNRLCLADYVRSAEDARDGERDVIALQLVISAASVLGRNGSSHGRALIRSVPPLPTTVTTVVDTTTAAPAPPPTAPPTTTTTPTTTWC